MNKLSNKQYASILYDVTKEVSGEDLEQVVKNFVVLLNANHKLKQTDKIIDEFIAYAKKQEGIMDIKITSAKKLDEKVIEQIKQIFGKQTESVEKQDESILGGVIIKTDELIFDASLKTQLNNLKNKISN